MITVTLKSLRQNEACFDGYNKVVRSIQGKEFTKADSERTSYIRFSHNDQIPLASILASNGLDDALWALRSAEQTLELQRACRLFAVWCARSVQNMTSDSRSIAAIDVAERHANGDATDDELEAAMDAARGAARAAAWDAAWDAARGAARAAAWDAAMAAASAAAWDAAMAAQKQKFIDVFCGDKINIEALYQKV